MITDDLFVDGVTSRTCMNCKVTKSAVDFYAHKGGHLRHECKACMNAKARARHKEKAKDPSYRRDKYLARYGITHDEYEKMLAAQNGVCAICQGEETKRWTHFSVDHNHETGEVRGLLCHTCNTGLGQFQDSPELLAEAANYLRLRGYFGD